MMKLTLFLIVIFNLQLSATGFSQSTVTINSKSADFKKIAAEIEKKSSYHFLFSERNVPQQKYLNFSADNEDVLKVVTRLLDGTSYTYNLLPNNLIAIVPTGTILTDIKVNGIVLDETGQALTGAIVKIKGLQTGVATDIKGAFTINAPDNATLIVTFIGYTPQEVPINGQNKLTINLVPSTQNLNEVVVVGYGTQKKRDLTGAYTSISAATLQEVPAQANVADQLQGRVAGLNISTTSASPGSVGQIRVRGERSFATNASTSDATNGPLFVVDGVPFINGSLNDIDPNDIANIEVLKDASATAIYGSRASGGVILVTTKRGKDGRTDVALNTSTGFSNAFGQYNIMNGPEYTAFKQQAQAGNSVNANNTAYPIYPEEQTGINNGTSTNWQKLLERTGLTTDTHLRISGGNEKAQYSVSGGYHSETGIEYGQSFSRGSLAFTLDQTISKIFKVGITSNNSLSYTNNSGDYFTATAQISPLVAPYNSDGSINVRPWPSSINGQTMVNPLTLKDPDIQAVSRRLVSNDVVYGEANIIDGLKYRLNASISYNQSQGNNYGPINTVANTNAIQSQSSASISNGENYVWEIENILSYDKTFNRRHHLIFTGLYSTEKDHTQSSGMSAQGIPADYLQSYNLFLANSTSVSNGNFSYAERGLISFMARAFYGFDDKYLFTATVRRDGSSVLGPGHQYFTYPAFAFAWNVDQEKFMKPVTWINSLKFRVGYGVTADQNISPYQILGNLSATAYNFGTSLQNGYVVTTIPNPNLQFEHTNNINLGLDFGILNSRITGSVDVYTQQTYNILQVESLPVSNGATTTTVNAGNSKGKGLEISLSSRNLTGKFKWSTDFNIAFARSWITSLHDGLQQDISNGWFVGQPFNVIYDYKKLGIWQTSEATQAAGYGEVPGMIKVQDVYNDGKIDANDRQILGSYQPQYTGGITNRFSYKGFDLTTVVFADMGQKVALDYYYQGTGGYYNIGRVNQLNTNYWTPTNPTNDYPRPNAGLTPLYSSTLQYQDGSFIKMKTISLGYNFPSSMLKNGPVRSLRVSASVNNAFVIWSPLVSKGLAFDPENTVLGGADVGSSGFSSNAIGRALTLGYTVPSARTFLLSINVGF